MSRSPCKAPTFDDYTFLNRWALSAVGMWKIRKETEQPVSRLQSNVHLTVVFILIMLLLVPQWLELYVFWGDMDTNIETLISNVFSTNAILKLVSYVLTDDTFDVSDLIPSLCQYQPPLPIILRSTINPLNPTSQL
jgi:hypothetical protein